MNPEIREHTEPPVILADGQEYYLRNEAAISEIVRNVREGHYCTILGPRFCQKSFLLADVRARLEEPGDTVCVLLNLPDVAFGSDEEFYGSFARMVHTHLQSKSGTAILPSADCVSDASSLRRFLQDCVGPLGCDLLLLLDHLERVRLGPLKSLLRVLRAIYMEREPDAPFRLGVVTASSLSVAELALGPTSPFNIARVTLVRDLEPVESEILTDFILKHERVSITPAGRARWVEATAGDRDLIPRLFTNCVDLMPDRAAPISRPVVETALQIFLDREAFRHRPILETIRAIEADPTTLMNVLKILKKGSVVRRDLELDLEATIDRLQLAGAVRVEHDRDQKVYFIRNEIYQRHLERHFQPERVARVFGMAGQWYGAIPFLEELVTDQQQYRPSLLGMVVNAIYAARNVDEACEHLARSLSQAFGIPKARVYVANSERSELKLVSHEGFEESLAEKLLVERGGLPEVRAFLGQDYAVTEIESEPVLLVPLMRSKKTPLGLVAVHGFEANPQREDFLALLAYLESVGKAIATVIDRERQLRQLDLLHTTGKEITSSLDLNQVLQTTVEAAIEAVPAAQKGSLFLWSDRLEKLVIRAQEGFRSDIVDAIQLGAGEGYAGWAYANRQPVLLGDVFADPRTKWIDHPDVKEEKSGICVPLEAWGRVIGVLCLDNATAYDAFQRSDLELLSTFGAQAAIAIQNARLYTELYDLGMSINRGDLGPRSIFRQAVQSIIRISDAKAANMFLLRDTDDPDLAVAQKPELSVSEGLGPDFDGKIKPRKGGLTHLVLREQRPLAVSEPNQSPGIHPLPYARGIRAYLCLPLQIREKTNGVLFVHYDKPHVFSDNEMEMLSLYANQAALAIENAWQRKQLTLPRPVVWMGITFADLRHRLRQNLAAIELGVLTLHRYLDKQGTLDEEILKIIEELTDDVQVAKATPGSLLSFEEQPECIDLNALIEEEIEKVKPSTERYLIQVDRSLTRQDTAVYADRQRLAFVFHVLISNAVEAARAADEPRLDLRSQVRGRRVVFEITNTGREIPDEVKNNLFIRPIYGSASLGVGLLIAKPTIGAYGGDVNLKGTGKAGTTFELWLPLHRTKNCR
jgi:GAF domain-containing protein